MRIPVTVFSVCLFLRFFWRDILREIHNKFHTRAREELKKAQILYFFIIIGVVVVFVAPLFYL